MSKKHYVAIARIISETPIADDAHASAIVADRGEIARKLADMFGEENPRFDRERFLIACGEDLGKERDEIERMKEEGAPSPDEIG